MSTKYGLMYAMASEAKRLSDASKSSIRKVYTKVKFDRSMTKGQMIEKILIEKFTEEALEDDSMGPRKGRQ